MAKTKKRSGSRKSSSGSSGSSSKQRKSTTSSSASATKRGRSRRANKSSRISNGKASARTSNGKSSPRVGNARGRFGGITRALKLTAIGTAGGVVTRLTSDAGVSLVTYAAPQVGVLRHWAARPTLSLLIAWFATARLFTMVGFNPESAESARVGGLIASGFDFVDGALPGSRERLASKFSFGRSQDRSLVTTNARTAIADGAAEQLIDNAAAAGAQAGAAAAMAGLGMMDDEGMIDSINEEDSGYLPGGDEYDADWDVGEDY